MSDDPKAKCFWRKRKGNKTKLRVRKYCDWNHTHVLAKMEVCQLTSHTRAGENGGVSANFKSPAENTVYF